MALAIGPFIVLLLIAINLLLPLVALISIFNNSFNGNDKLIWVLVVLFLPILGSILYFIIGRPKIKHQNIRNS